MYLQPDIKSQFISLPSLNMHYLHCDGRSDTGKGDTMVFLHGFPEFSLAWYQQLNFFASSHRVISPDLPGYGQSDKPDSVDFYQVPNLIKVLSEFIENVAQGEQVILVAHDWGGAIAWPLVAFRPELIKKLVILNAAHPSTFTREMMSNAEQRSKSEYIHTLISGNAIQEVAANDYAYLQEAIFSELTSECPTHQLLTEYKTAWGIKGALPSMLKYYQAMPQLAPANDAGNKQGPVTELADMHIPKIFIKLPTLVLWGEQDKAFVPQVLDGLSDYVADVEIQRLSDVGHWLAHERAEWVNQKIESFASGA